MIPVHVAKSDFSPFLFLKKEGEGYQWHELNTALEDERPIDCKGSSPSLAILNARRLWKEKGFKLLNCGFRYTLPERDEVGARAFFWQMAESYASMNRNYFDPEVGHLCYVDFASQEALEVWRRLRERNNRPL